MTEISQNPGPIDQRAAESSVRENSPTQEVPTKSLGWWHRLRNRLSFSGQKKATVAPSIGEVKMEPEPPTHEVGSASSNALEDSITIAGGAQRDINEGVPLNPKAAAPNIDDEMRQLLNGPLAAAVDNLRSPVELPNEQRLGFIENGANYFDQALNQTGIKIGKFPGFRLSSGGLLILKNDQHRRYDIGPAFLYLMDEVKRNEKDSESIAMIRYEEARLRAFLEGYGDRAATQGDFLTALATFDALLPGGLNNPLMKERMQKWEEEPGNVKLLADQRERYEGIKARQGGKSILNRAYYPQRA